MGTTQIITDTDPSTEGTNTDYWVDLSTDGSHGYTWGHGGALPLESALWAPNRPDYSGTDGEQMCVRLKKANGRFDLDDALCSYLFNYICEVIAA